MTPVAWMREILEAADERGWMVVFVDARAGVVVLEEPLAIGVVLRISGKTLDAAFIRALPEARQPA